MAAAVSGSIRLALLPVTPAPDDEKPHALPGRDALARVGGCGHEISGAVCDW
jgi:hypothetical protein